MVAGAYLPPRQDSSTLARHESLGALSYVSQAGAIASGLGGRVKHKSRIRAKGPIPRGTGKLPCELLLYSSLYPVRRKTDISIFRP